jgi:hypothetical protein
MKRIVLIGSLSILIATVAYTYNINQPNLRDANASVEQAIQHIREAQQAAKGIEFGGHDDKAIQHLNQAEYELIEADKWYSAHQKK